MFVKQPFRNSKKDGFYIMQASKSFFNYLRKGSAREMLGGFYVRTRVTDCIHSVPKITKIMSKFVFI